MRTGKLTIEIYDDPQYAVVDQEGKRTYAVSKAELFDLLEAKIPDIATKQESYGAIKVEETNDNNEE